MACGGSYDFLDLTGWIMAAVYVVNTMCRKRINIIGLNLCQDLTVYGPYAPVRIRSSKYHD